MRKIILYILLLTSISKAIEIEEKTMEVPLFKDAKTFTKHHLSSFQRLVEARYLYGGSTKFIDSSLPTLPMVTFKELQYWGVIGFGSQKAPFKMMFDTGSAWAWVPSEFCQGCRAFTQNSFSCSLSKTCQTSFFGTAIQYGKGKVQGRIVWDDVWITKDQKAKRQPFLLVTQSAEMPKLKFDGIAGLGFRIMCSGFPTIVDTLFETNVIAKKSFSVYLESLKTSSYKSAIVFGGVNKKYMGESKFHYCNVLGPIYWGIRLNYIIIKTSKRQSIIGKEGGFEGHNRISGYKSVIDTGTSLIHLQRNDFIGFSRAFMSMVPNCFFNPKLNMIECFNVGQEFPEIIFNFCGKEFSVKPVSYLWGTNLLKLILISQINMKGNPINIMGDVLMKEYYFDFNQGDRKIGIMKKGKPSN